MDKISVTIATGASLSGASIALPEGLSLVGFETDAEWDANAVSFQGLSTDGSTWKNIYTKDALGGEYLTGSVAASTYTPIDPAVFYGKKSFKFRSGTSATPVNQSGATTINLVFASL